MRRSRSPVENVNNLNQQQQKSLSSILPRFGLGTFRLKGAKCTQAVTTALDLGVTLIDTAESYKNAAEIQKAISSSSENNNIMLITKISKESLSDKQGPAAGVAKVITAQSKLLYPNENENNNLHPLDVVLLHWPGTANSNPKSPQHKIARIEAWRALVDEQNVKKRVKYIGVSNFTISHLQELEAANLPLPQINQVECHPYCQQRELRKYCKENGILLQAYTSLGRSVEGPRCLYGNWEPTLPKLVKDPLIVQIVKEMNEIIINENNTNDGKWKKMTPELLLLRWAIENDLWIVPKATSKEHIEENLRCREEDFWKVIDEGMTRKKCDSSSWVTRISDDITIPETETTKKGCESVTYAYPKEKVPI